MIESRVTMSRVPNQADMAKSTTINKCIFAEFRFWQGFSGENRLKSHR